MRRSIKTKHHESFTFIQWMQAHPDHIMRRIETVIDENGIVVLECLDCQDKEYSYIYDSIRSLEKTEFIL